jgi:hypothetical protein
MQGLVAGSGRLVRRFTRNIARLHQRLMPGARAAIELATMTWIAQGLAAFCELGLPRALADGPRTPAQLSSAGFGDEAMLLRLLRSLSGYGVVRYAGNDRFALAHIGRALVGDRSAEAMVLYANAPWHVGAYAHLAQTVRTGRSGFELAHGRSMFEFLAEKPEAGALFDAAMRCLTPQYATAMAQAYDFSTFGHIIDVGGGTGALLATVLKHFPTLHGTIFELPAVAARARKVARDGELAQRIGAVDGNMFTDAPPCADAYILSHVLHDWDDDLCVRILQNVRRAMPAAARLLVYEVVVAPPNAAWSKDRISDLEMMAMLSGRERTREDFSSLLARSGLRLRRILRTAAPESIIEAVRDDEI